MTGLGFDSPVYFLFWFLLFVSELNFMNHCLSKKRIHSFL